MKKLLCAVLCAVMLLQCAVLNAAALSDELLEYRKTGHYKAYDPAADGYYGYLAVEHFDVMGEKAVTGSLPVLVKDGHVLVNSVEFASAAGLAFTELGGGGFSIRVYKKTVTFGKNSSSVHLNQGRVSQDYNMGISTVWQDGYLWIPLQSTCMLLNMDLLVLDKPCVTIGHPKQDILDVAAAAEEIGLVDLTTIYDLSAMQGFSLGFGSQIVDNMDGILHFELDKLWDATSFMNPVAIVSDYINGRMTDKTYAEDVTKVILNRMSDEVKLLDSVGYGMYDTVLNTVLGYDGTFEMGSDALETLLKQMADAGKAYSGTVNPKAVAGWLKKAADAGHKATGVASVVDNGTKIFAAGYKTFNLLMDIEHQQTMATEGMQMVLDRRKNGYMTKNARKGVSKVLEAYSADPASGDVAEAYSLMLDENMSTVVDVLVGTAIGPAAAFFSVYNAGAAVVPEWNAGLKAAECYQQSLVAYTIQGDAYYAMLDQFDKLFSGKRGSVRSEELENTAKLMYAFLKSTYVTRDLGVAAMTKQEGTQTYDAQFSEMSREARLMATLMEFSPDSYLDPTEIKAEMDKGMPDDFLREYVSGCYVHMFITVTDGETGEAVPHADVEMNFDEYQNLTFSVDADGRFEFYMPLKWEDSLSGSMYPNPASTAPAVDLVVTHPDYPDPAEVSFSNYEMTDLEGTNPVREVRLKMDVVMGDLDYWQFIHDRLVPEYGYCPEQYSIGRDQEIEFTGIMGAQVLDLNLDGVEDMILLRVGERPFFAVMDLYTKENGKITLVQSVDIIGSSVGSYEAHMSILYLDDVPYIYVHEERDFTSLCDDYHVFWRYGNDGMYEVAKMGFAAGAGPRRDEFYCVADNFRGMSMDVHDDQLIYGSKRERKMERWAYQYMEELGLPTPSDWTHKNENGGMVTTTADYWNNPACENVIAFYKSGDFGFHANLEDCSPLMEQMAQFPDFNPANPRNS